MKVKGASFSKYKVKLNCYTFYPLDLFSFLFAQIILDDSLNKDKKIVDCLKDLDIKDDLLYLFNNVYYRFVDNFIIEDTYKEDIYELLIKDIKVNPYFIEYLKQGYFPEFNEEIEKGFIYDYLNNRVVLEDKIFDDSNICVFEISNDNSSIEKIINDNKKSLLDIKDGVCIVKDVIVDPYYFDFELEKSNSRLKSNSKNKEEIYKALENNSLFISDKIVEGEFLSNNIYYECLFANETLKDYCKYLFVNNKEREFEVDNNVIYVDYDFNYDYLDLISKQGYECGKYLLENDKYISTFNVNKCKEVSDFKLYLIKNKDKFKVNIDKIIGLI